MVEFAAANTWASVAGDTMTLPSLSTSTFAPASSASQSSQAASTDVVLTT